MNSKLLFIFATLLLFSCHEDTLEVGGTCHQMETNLEYVSEDFKPSYTIQFPENYSGEGLHLGWGATLFQKQSPEGTIYNCQFLCPTDCHIYFGPALEIPFPEQILYSDFSNQNTGEVLDEKIEFCIDEEVYMILYYTSGEFNKSKLYMKDDESYKEALTVDFEIDQINNVVEILKTIEKI